MKVLKFFAVMMTIIGIWQTASGNTHVWEIWLGTSLVFYLPLILIKVYRVRKAKREEEEQDRAFMQELRRCKEAGYETVEVDGVTIHLGGL